MTNVIRIKRRVSGNAGAPASLKSAELAHNEVDNTLYIGKGDDGSGNATSIAAVAGAGSFADLSSTQTIGGAKTFSIVPKSSQDASGATDLVRKSQFDSGLAAKANTSHSHAISDVTGLQTALDGKAASSHTHGISDVTGLQTALDNKLDDSQATGFGLSLLDDADAAAARTTLGLGTAATSNTTAFAPAAHSHAVSDVTGLQAALDAKAPLASPIFTGTPAAPTPAADTNTTQVATTAFVVGQASASNPVMNGAVAIGGSLKFARADHVHPTDTSRAPLASPTFTGTPAAPTPANGTNTTQIATTAFVRATRIDQLAQPTADVAFNARKITGLADPTSAQDAATKNYVDLAVQGLDPKQSVKAASTANITSLSGAMTIDGVALVAGDRVLVKDQSTASANGVYVVAASAWSRATDMDIWDELVSAYLFVEQGTVNADMGFLCTVDAGGTLGTTSVTFVQFSGAGQVTAGAGLTRTGNTIDVGTASTGRIVINADSIDLATTAVSAGTYRSVTVDTYGRVTAGSNPTTLSGYGITDAQPLDATLTALAGLATVADRLPYSTGADTFALATFTAFGRSLVDDADAAAGRTTLGLGTMATQAASAVAITGGTINGVTLDGGTF
ncbi:hypothetical protein [Aquibium sp. ELW1220]|uniref:hypothetical protein n=1 Tax=Aquibium sp. ELW1220 TaxID=2976766 RepID=UPI0025AF4D46|nr:hypothetical protein [Aquibium sp. ELW1220]MDN2578959.1 hypothetical protein [Aquibium sp. ELW1220]